MARTPGISCADCGCVPSADVGFERLRSAINVVAAATCADLPAPVEDDPGFVVVSEPESWWLGFAARHDGLTNLRMARGVVRSLPATLAISRVPAAAALRNDDNVKDLVEKTPQQPRQGSLLRPRPIGRDRAVLSRERACRCCASAYDERGAHGFARPLPRPSVQRLRDICSSRSVMPWALPVCTENLIRVDDAPESPKLAE